MIVQQKEARHTSWHARSGGEHACGLAHTQQKASLLHVRRFCILLPLDIRCLCISEEKPDIATSLQKQYRIRK